MRASLPLRLAVMSVTTLSVTGCTTSELSQPWQLDRLRVLGVQAEPAEPRPGDTVQFSSLVYIPADEPIDGILWFACLPESADDFGCVLETDIAALDAEDPENNDFETLAELGIIGFEPLVPPVWVTPEDALDGFDEQAAQEGVSALVNVAAFPEGAEEQTDLEISFKRVPISLAPTPNENPELVDVTIDGASWNLDEVFVTNTGRAHTLEPILSEASIETYQFTTSEGVVEDRVEEPYFSFYVEAGSVDQAFSLYPFNSIEWTAPDDPFEGLVVVTVRDRRGGMTWTSFRVQVVP
ncbi:MAG: hypothetical protein AAFV53_17935 [Myxococcota bacterium]